MEFSQNVAVTQLMTACLCSVISWQVVAALANGSLPEALTLVDSLDNTTIFVPSDAAFMAAFAELGEHATTAAAAFQAALALPGTPVREYTPGMGYMGNNISTADLFAATLEYHVLPGDARPHATFPPPAAPAAMPMHRPPPRPGASSA